MKVAVLGASGLVGRSIFSLLKSQNIDSIGTYHTSPFPDGVKLSLTDIQSLELFLKENKITACINCIAERNVDLCEKEWEKIVEINCYFASRLAEACCCENIYLLHISTDYVFSGNEPPYYPDSNTCAIQAYGRSKELAEKEVIGKHSRSCIVRVPVLYTHLYKTLNETAVSILGKKVIDKTREWTEDNYFIRRPVFIEDMCYFLFDCLMKEKTGIYHFYNPNNALTKYQMIQHIGNYLGKDTLHISPQNTPSTVAGRPYDTHLLDTQYERSSYPNTSITEGIARCFNKLKHPLIKIDVSPSEPIFFMIDLDGTLVNTEKLHFESYTKAFQQHGYTFCNWDSYQKLSSIEDYCRASLGEEYNLVKETKNNLLYSEPSIHFIQGAEVFLDWLLQNKQNFVIVTNTSQRTVDFYKEKLPILQKISQWITRNDVINAKPNMEPYMLAKSKYWKEEQYIIGIENTVCGYEALKNISSCIYLITEYNSNTYNALCNNDIYIIKDLSDIYTSVAK